METSTTTYHKPVLLHQSVAGLNINPCGTYVDVTFGAGGHSKAILQQLDEKGRLFAFDQDEDAIKNSIDNHRFTLIHANFRHIKRFLKLHEVEKVDGILADLGVSSHQIDNQERGFSTRFDCQLDMRMDKRKSFTATDILNTYEEKDLSRVFYQYGEVKNARKLAFEIVKERKNQEIASSKQFIEIIQKHIPKQRENKYLAQLYQALRIEVNRELEALQEFLLQSIDLLNTGGRLLIISYHSLEDRMVKQFMRSGNMEDKIKKDFYGNPLTPFHLITRKAIVPDENEMIENPRSRSAKLRIAEKK
ncbi:MAG: 16S rRNA (cytosine(1402)-N(4))-methyltransferase RsmH [Bacteroidales bacterium]|nr:16S rRNA (cytosine(1402)-N(4))-methyltransferase RsmH [Bacteroidales bacterium]